MKNLIVLLFLIIVIGVQGQDSKKIEIHTCIGTSYSFPYSKTFDDFNVSKDIQSSIGYYFDINIDYLLNNHFSLSGGLNLYQIKFGVNNVIFPNENRRVSRDGYVNTINLSFPTFLKYQISDKIPISFGIGPYFDIIVRAKIKYVEKFYGFDPAIDNSYFYHGITDSYRTFDLGTSFLMQYTLLRIKHFSVFFSSKLNYGLINVRKETDNHMKNHQHWKNYNILSGIGVNF